MATATKTYNVAPNPNDAAQGGLPVGAITLWSLSNAPSQWLLCDGTAVSRNTYATLYSVIGTTYGAGDGNTTFNVPNATNSVVRGLGDTFNQLGYRAGADSVTLVPNNLPQHIHPITDVSHSHVYTSFGETYQVNAGIGGDRAGNQGTNTTAKAFTGITQTEVNATTNSPFQIVNQFVTLNYIIKAF